jgi:hypothetical protein
MSHLERPTPEEMAYMCGWRVARDSVARYLGEKIAQSDAERRGAIEEGNKVVANYWTIVRTTQSSIANAVRELVPCKAPR